MSPQAHKHISQLFCSIDRFQVSLLCDIFLEIAGQAVVLQATFWNIKIILASCTVDHCCK